MHALLDHLREAGFHAAPRPLGLDERGCEVLEFVPGTTVWPDRFSEVGPPDRLARVGHMIREFHDAVAGFTPPPDAVWQVVIPAEDWAQLWGDGHGEFWRRDTDYIAHREQEWLTALLG